MRYRTLVPAYLAALTVAACASGGGAPAAELDSTYEFAGVKSVYVETPVRVTVRGSDGVGNPEIAATAERELREYLRAQRGWQLAGTPADADLAVRLQVTDWEPGSTGSRVGATIELIRPSDAVRVLRASTTYPSRFGTPAPGAPIDLMEPLFERLFEDVK